MSQALQAAFNLPSNVDQADAQSRWQDAHLNPDQRDFSLADHKFKEVANQVNNDINKVTTTATADPLALITATGNYGDTGDKHPDHSWSATEQQAYVANSFWDLNGLICKRNYYYARNYLIWTNKNPLK